jgi:hypothetical protein
MDLEERRRQALARWRADAWREYVTAIDEWARLDRPDPLTGRVWRRNPLRWRARRRVRLAARDVRRSERRRYTR